MRGDLIIGKDSMIRHGAKEAKLGIEAVAALTGLDGETMIKGFLVVRAKDKALVPADLQGYRHNFGNEDADGTFAAGLVMLIGLEVKVPDAKEMCDSCSTVAKKVVDGHAGGGMVAAIISSYAQPLLEGCGPVKMSEFRVVGGTDEVPFITAFVNTN